MNLTLGIEIIKFLFVLSFLVIIHEVGHFVLARVFKVRVEEFGLGYPPRAKTLFEWAGTVFTLNWFPFGGFVKLEGEDGPEPTATTTAAAAGTSTKKEVAPFYQKSMAARLAIILAGATVNFLFGILAFSIYFSIMGIPQLVDVARIGEVAPDSPAAHATLPMDVNIVALVAQQQRTPIKTAEDAQQLIGTHVGETVTLVTSGHCEEAKCDAAEQKFDVYIRKKEEIPAGQGAVGIRFAPVIDHQFYPWYQMPFRGAAYGTKQAVFLSYFIVRSLGDLIVNAVHGQVPQEVAGPVGIFTQARKAGFFSSGYLELLNFAGLLSVNLAIMNVLPIPALDGGRALFILLEKIIGKKRVQAFEGYANYVGFAVLIGLIVIVTFKDIVGIFLSKGS